MGIGERPAQTSQGATPGPQSSAPRPDGSAQVPNARQPARPAAVLRPRAEVIADAPRLPIDTPSLRGSIALKGGRIDDLVLAKYTNELDPESGNVVLLTPSGVQDAYFSEFGWSALPGASIKLPNADTMWRAEGAGRLTPETPVTLIWENGEGLTFRRTISVDENYMFSIRQEVVNSGERDIQLAPYAFVSRIGLPETTTFLIMHEGFIGVPGSEDDLKEVHYDDDALYDDDAARRPGSIKYEERTGGWLGFTDKYWAAVVIPDQTTTYNASYSYVTAFNDLRFQADYIAKPVLIPAGQTTAIESKMFAGAKEVALVDGYDTQLGIDRFELLIDWGWLYFLTKPLFYALDYCYQLIGNFGLAILIVTIIIKLVLFPFANKSYVSMSKMKKLQPELERIKNRHEGDMVRQQQAMAEFYKKEKVNPAAGCWPMLIQIPVFFALYKVLFVNIEMRQAPFYGWIKDLSAPDPTTIWNLFGLLPYDPSWIVPAFLMVGAWPVMMGLIMFVQMRLNPTPTDPTQAMIFTWMPVLFTFILAQFPAGLVLYWTWNNLLSVIQQGYIMSRQGVEIALWENLGLKSKRADESTKS